MYILGNVTRMYTLPLVEAVLPDVWFSMSVELLNCNDTNTLLNTQF